MKLRTLIVDDEPIALEKLKAYTLRVPFLELAGECGSGIDAVEFLASEKVDLVFTDINMPDLNGMEFVASLLNSPMVVFTTAYAEYGAESYRVSAIDYLLKPYGFADFQRAANKALELYRLRNGAVQNPKADADSQRSLFLKVDYRHVRVVTSDILYIKGYGEYLQVYLAGKQQPIVTLSSFAAIKDRLPRNFLQVHRSYIVNMERVDNIERGRIVVEGGDGIPVGDSYRQSLAAYLRK